MLISAHLFVPLAAFLLVGPCAAHRGEANLGTMTLDVDRRGALVHRSRTPAGKVADTAGRDGAEVERSAQAVESESGRERVAGSPLTMAKCPRTDVNDMKVGTAAIYCERLVSLSRNLTTNDAYHCGLQLAAKGDPSIVRRYDLGPRPFQVDLHPLAIAAIAIACTEGADLHGKKEGKEQILWSDAPTAEVQRDITFAQVQDYIQNGPNLVPNHYDLFGGNCQHWSFLMYEYLTKQACYSITRPNDDTYGELLDFLGESLADKIVGVLKKFSNSYQDLHHVEHLAPTECTT